MGENQLNLGAAARLEDLQIALKDFVLDFRADMGRKSLYARLYWLRRELTYLARDFGEGLPPNDEIMNLQAKYGEYK